MYRRLFTRRPTAVGLVAAVTLLAIHCVPTRAFAQATEPDAQASLASIDEVVVTGEQPGPGLWKVTHGGTNVVWVPKDVKWRSRQVEEVIAHAKAVVFGESVTSNIGIFRGLLLLPAAMKARFNPDKALLKDMVTPEKYEHWLVLRKEYFKDDEDIERMRPMFIALRSAAPAEDRARHPRFAVVAGFVDRLGRRPPPSPPVLRSIRRPALTCVEGPEAAPRAPRALARARRVVLHQRADVTD